MEAEAVDCVTQVPLAVPRATSPSSSLGRAGSKVRNSRVQSQKENIAAPVELMGRSGGLSVHGASVGATSTTLEYLGFFSWKPKALGRRNAKLARCLFGRGLFLYPVGNVPVWE